MRFRCRNKKSIDPEKVNVLAKALIDKFSFYTCGQELPTLQPVMEDNQRLDVCRKKIDIPVARYFPGKVSVLKVSVENSSFFV